MLSSQGSISEIEGSYACLTFIAASIDHAITEPEAWEVFLNRTFSASIQGGL